MPDLTENDLNNNKHKESLALDIAKDAGDGLVTSNPPKDPEEQENMANGDATFLQVGESSVILESNVERIFLSALVVLKQNCQELVVPRGTHGHAHVGGRARDMKVFSKEGHPWGSLDIYRDSLAEKINTPSCFVESWKKIRLLQQIASGLEYLHEHGRPHGNLTAKSIFLSCDDRNHPVIIEGLEAKRPFTDNLNELKEKDIRDFGYLTYYVLTNGMSYPDKPEQDPYNIIDANDLKCEDSETAKDLLVKMLNDKPPIITMQQVLRHPLFWIEEEKMKFITDHFDAVSQNRDSIKPIENAAKKLVFKGEWKGALLLTSRDKDEIEKLVDETDVNMDKIFRMAGGAKTKKTKNMKFLIYIHKNNKLVKVDGIDARKWKNLIEKATNDKENMPSVSQAVIHELLKKKHKDIEIEDFDIFDRIVLVKTEEDGGYDKESFYDLLRFFRNKKAHFSELDSQAKNYFQALGGYWKFFCARYPNLLTFVYNHKDCFAYQQTASL